MKRLEIVNEKLWQTTQIGISKTISDQRCLVDVIDGIDDGIPKTIQQQEHLLHILKSSLTSFESFYQIIICLFVVCALHTARSEFKNQR